MVAFFRENVRHRMEVVYQQCPCLCYIPCHKHTALNKPALCIIPSLPCSPQSKVTIISEKHVTQREWDLEAFEVSRQEKHGQNQTESGKAWDWSALTHYAAAPTVGCRHISATRFNKSKNQNHCFVARKQTRQLIYRACAHVSCVQHTHRVPEAVIFVDMSWGGAQFDAVT